MPILQLPPSAAGTTERPWSRLIGQVTGNPWVGELSVFQTPMERTVGAFADLIGPSGVTPGAFGAVRATGPDPILARRILEGAREKMPRRLWEYVQQHPRTATVDVRPSKWVSDPSGRGHEAMGWYAAGPQNTDIRVAAGAPRSPEAIAGHELTHFAQHTAGVPMVNPPGLKVTPDLARQYRALGYSPHGEALPYAVDVPENVQFPGNIQEVMRLVDWLERTFPTARATQQARGRVKETFRGITE